MRALRHDTEMAVKFAVLFLFLIFSIELRLFCSNIVLRTMGFVEAVVCWLARCVSCSERKPVVRALFYVTAACFGVGYSRCHYYLKTVQYYRQILSEKP